MNELDDHIGELINKLQSSKTNARYEACEELRVAPSIPPEAIQALQKALEDPDASVADAAQRALAVHLAPEPATDLSPKEEVQEKPKARGVKYWPLIGLLVGWIPGLVIAVLGFGGLSMIFAPIGILFGMLGAYLGRKRMIIAWFLAILFSSSFYLFLVWMYVIFIMV